MSRPHTAGCTGKKTFIRFLEAQRVAKRRRQADGGAHVEPYKCRHCNQFHIGEAHGYGKRGPMPEI